MPLNLITDAWIPVVRRGIPVIICPHEIADDGVERLNWPREDLNLACMELLVGLVYLADPPIGDSDWHGRYYKPDPERLRGAISPFSPHFELDGDGPRFLQDFEPFERHAVKKDIHLPEMLFIDSAGINTVKKNSDLMVKRNRYSNLDLSLAAMALYTLQAFAPSGGSGIRTSMRGGGPLTTLMKPLEGGANPLWRFVWCNVPEGQCLGVENAKLALPWLRPTLTSEKQQTVTQEMSHFAEVFFGMPRRIRLMFNGNSVTGVVQRRHGANYDHWQHPLSPYYSKEAGGQRIATHPKPGRLSYRNWLGIAFGRDHDLRFKAHAVSRYLSLLDAPAAEVCAGGWAMNNMKSCDFISDVYPTFNLDTEMDIRVSQLVEAANSVVSKLSKYLKDAISLQGFAVNSVQESFFDSTEHNFICAVRDIVRGCGAEVEREWIAMLKRTALMFFDQYTLPALSERGVSNIEKAVKARRSLISFFESKAGVNKILPSTLDTG